jgi:hypothetical protein
MSAQSGANIWIRLDKKAAEKQDAQQHNDSDDDDLNERHGQLPHFRGQCSQWAMSKLILEVPE